MSIQKLYKKMARLESMNDQLEMELYELDDLLRQVGFPGGLHSAKEIAKELIDEGNENVQEKSELGEENVELGEEISENSKINHRSTQEKPRFSGENNFYEQN